jgi:hypothetical protein
MLVPAENSWPSPQRCGEGSQFSAGGSDRESPTEDRILKASSKPKDNLSRVERRAPQALGTNATLLSRAMQGWFSTPVIATTRVSEMKTVKNFLNLIY